MNIAKDVIEELMASTFGHLSMGGAQRRPHRAAQWCSLGLAAWPGGQDI